MADPAVSALVPRYLPGEQEAIATVQALGAAYGYGNLIFWLSEAWSAKLQADGMPKLAADRSARHICAWCDIDSRTGKKAKRNG